MNATDREPHAISQDEVVARLAIMQLDKMGPARSAWLLGDGPATEAVALLRRGRVRSDAQQAPHGTTRPLLERWRRDLADFDPEPILERHHSRGIEIMTPQDDRWPFHGDPEPPLLLFHRGNPALLDQVPRVAVVGTRRCTTVGRSAAHRLGSELARLEVPVVSGLALGVDGSAHRGTLAAGGTAIAVVATGLDVVYPVGNRRLWQEIAEQGLLVSEAPAGVKPERWRFPARNRLIAALSEAAVIVESHHRGGSLITADEASLRGRTVFAVPGSVLSPASDGSNQLLAEGAGVVRTATDLLHAIGLDQRATIPDEPDTDAGSPSRRPRSDLDLRILAEAAAGPAHVDALVASSGRSVSEVLVAVRRLVADGLLVLSGSTVSPAPAPGTGRGGESERPDR